MKRLFFLIAVTAGMAVPVLAQESQNESTIFNKSFEEVYDSRTEFLNEVTKKMKSGDVRPVWQEDGSFLYKQGENYYKVSPDSKSVSASTEADFNKAMEGMRGYYDPSDETLYTVKIQDPQKSPDGKLEAVLRDNNIWIRPAGSTDTPKQLSYDGNDKNPYYRVMWSPDSRKIAGYRKEIIKERQIILRMSRPEDQLQPTYRYLDYCKPGDVLPQITPALFDVANMKQIPFSTGAYSNQYFLEPGQWSPDSKYFTFEYNQRGHQLYQLVAVDATTGKNTILAEEKTNTFVYYYDIFRYYFQDGKRILWTSERDNWRHLYLIDAQKNTIKQLTKGEWNVREVQWVDEQKGQVYMYVNGLNAKSGEDPYNKHFVRLDMASGKITDLTPSNANHTVSLSGNHKYFTDSYSRPDYPGGSVLRSLADGSEVMELGKTDISELVAAGFTMPKVFSAKGRDGKTDIWGTIFYPYNFDESKKYPVVEYIYAGPHDSHVFKDFYPTMRFNRLMEMGFIVVSIDGMGTDNRSKDFQDVAWRNIKDAGFPDRILWMKAAAEKYPYMDISNVGIYGYSAGGQNTLAALLFHPEFYKVGVALCGCHDNRMDKMWWNEQWMGYPIGPWYSESSNVDNAWRLEGKLFIINGEIDDNVDPASSLQVVSELVKHNKYFEQMFLPGHTHALGSDYISKRAFEFFYRNIIQAKEEAKN